jgi:aryl carrier-like protein
MRLYGWIYQATLIAEHEKIKLDEVYDLPTLQALNDLSYLKSKQAFDSEQMKKAYGKH